MEEQDRNRVFDLVTLSHVSATPNSLDDDSWSFPVTHKEKEEIPQETFSGSDTLQREHIVKSSSLGVFVDRERQGLTPEPLNPGP